MSSSLHIGKLIKAKVEALGISKSEFARRVNTSPQNMHGILKRKSVDSEMLHRINLVLNYNFFDEYESPAGPNGVKEPRYDYKMASLEERLSQAQREIDYLRQIKSLNEDKISTLEQKIQQLKSK